MSEDNTPLGGVIHAWRAAPDLTDVDPMIRPDWHDRANCGRNGTIGDDATARMALMFATDRRDAEEAVAVCEGCPAKAPCAATKREIGQSAQGVWAGIAPPQRNKSTRDRGTSAKWPAATVREMRDRVAAGERQQDVADAYGITQSSLSMIVNRRSYKWVA